MDTAIDAIVLLQLLNLTRVSLLALKSKLKPPKRRHRFWVREVFQNRERYGYHARLIRELRSQDQQYYFDFMRMTPEIFDLIHEKIKPFITKEDTFFRRSISTQERLGLTLRFLATGETFRSLSFAFRIGRATLSKIIPETCNAIWECLREEYMPFPSSSEEWKQIAKGFNDKWQLPHCCGSIDGKHIIRQCPNNTGSLHYNYKGTFSSVLMAVADYQYRFLMIDYGHYGSESDGGIFRKCSLGQLLLNHELNLPESKPLPNSTKSFPYFLIGDEAFPLRLNLLRPYPRNSKFTLSQKIYNYRLSRARRIVENAFGILVARFRMFRRPLNYCDSTTKSMVIAACVLHNMLLQQSPAHCPSGYADYENTEHVVVPGQWRGESSDCVGSLRQMSSNMYK